MQSELRVRLEAVDASRNVHRGYLVQAGRDLFGSWTVQVRYGRIGSPHGAVLNVYAGSEERARKAVMSALRKRLSSPKRIGVPYVVVEAVLPPGDEAARWLPDGLAHADAYASAMRVGT